VQTSSLFTLTLGALALAGSALGWEKRKPAPVPVPQSPTPGR
jgi:hypothetical protein